ncbi:MAG: DUF3119 family protein [Cyanobacteria bacterium REEB459]|nr:DUF3119 family protein [Cyanobacteria bacterium REEB459]
MSSPDSLPTTELSPHYPIPLVVLALALPLLWLQLWLGIAVAIFGGFLLVQTLTLRLRFTSTALEVYRQQTQIRHFPYADWQYWQVFWLPVPILFYFREVNSIHFLPMLFKPAELISCLERHCPNPRD